MSQPEPEKNWRQRALLTGLAVLSAVLIYLAFPPADVGPLIFVAYVPWLYVLNTTSFRGAAAFSFLMGAVLYASSLYWISVVTLAGLFPVTVILASFSVAAGLGIRSLRKGFGFPLGLAAPLGFVAIDLLRTYFPYGFPWLFPGHALYQQNLLIQCADLFGVYGLTAMVLAFNGSILDVALWWKGGRKGRKALIPILATVAAMVLATAYGAIRRDPGRETGPRVLCVQGNIPQDVKNAGQSAQDIWATHVRLSFEGAHTRPDLVIWPETMVPLPLSNNSEMLSGLIALSKELDTPFLVGTVWFEAQDNGDLGAYNTAVLVHPDGTLGGRYDKIHRVPGGEFIPFRSVFPFVEPIIRNAFGYIPDVTPGRRYTRFIAQSPDGAEHPFGVVICFENVFPYLVSGNKRHGASFIVNITNDAWFKDSTEFEQVLPLACFRAVENRFTVVRAANSGITALVGPDGVPYRVLEVDGKRKVVEGWLDGVVRLDGRWTLYAAAGDIFAYLVAAACSVLWGLLFWRRGRQVFA